MIKNNFVKVGFLILLLYFLTIENITAQQYSTIHWMQGIPQSIYTNPGLYPDARIYVGMPGSSSINFGFAHSGFKPEDLLRKNSDGSFYIDDNNMLSKLNDKNFMGIDYQHEVLAFGFKSRRDNYYSFNLTEKANLRFGYPKDLLFLMVKGNDFFAEADRKADFNGIGVNASYYHELGVGFSRHWLDQLTAGARVKLLFGIGNVNSEKTNLSFYTNPDTYEYNLSADILVNTSLPFLDIEVDDDEGFNITDKEGVQPEDIFVSMNNLGFAIDLGGVYEIDDRFSVALSVIDLGFISWTSDVSNIAIKGEFDFRGVGFSDIFGDDGDDFGEVFLDSINDMFEFEESKASYRTMLPTQILLSGTYNISEIHKAGLMARGLFYDGSFYPSFTAAYSIQPIKAIGASLSYSIIYGNYSNIGAGLHLNIWPLQIYIVTDNFVPALRPHITQNTTVQLGLNWVIGYKAKDIGTPLYSW